MEIHWQGSTVSSMFNAEALCVFFQPLRVTITSTVLLQRIFRIIATKALQLKKILLGVHSQHFQTSTLKHVVGHAGLLVML